MAQHFLLSTAARTLSLSVVARMSDQEALEAFKLIRWSDNEGKPYCPKCGCVALYARANRYRRLSVNHGAVWIIFGFKLRYFYSKE